jgi:hypothetical protein
VAEVPFRAHVAEDRPALTVLSTDELVNVFAEVSVRGVRPSGFLDESEELQQYVVERVGGRPTVVDQESEPERSGIQEQPGAVGSKLTMRGDTLDAIVAS